MMGQCIKRWVALNIVRAAIVLPSQLEAARWKGEILWYLAKFATPIVRSLRGEQRLRRGGLVRFMMSWLLEAFNGCEYNS